MNDRSNQMDQEAAELMETLDVPVLASDAKAVQAVDAMDDLKQEILGFFKNRIKSISRAERIKELIFEQFEMDIQSGALKFDQMMSLLMRLDRDNNDSADSIISMFRPSGNGQGSLLTEIVRPGTDKSDLAKAIENYSPEELRKINETFKAIRELVESGGTVSVETQDGKNPAVEM